MASKWDDDDDVVRPAVQSPKKDLRSELDDWQTKVNTAAKQSKESALATDPPAMPSRKASLQVEHDATPEPPPPPPKLSEKEIASLQKQAEASANDVAYRASLGKRTSKKVRLRVKVSGWYEGSVPAVDFCDGKPHFFPRAPTKALDTAEQYLKYWRTPFVARLRSLGFEILEQDI